MSRNATRHHLTIQYKLLLTPITILSIGVDHIFGYRLLFYVLYQLDFEIHHWIIWKSETYGIHSLATQPRDRGMAVWDLTLV